MNVKLVVVLTAALGLLAGLPNAGATAKAPRCHTADLRITVVRFGGAAGTIAGDLGFRNRSRYSCFVYGYPGLGLEDAHHVVMHSRVTWGSTVARRDPGPHRIVLLPGKAAFANLSFGDVPVGSERCAPSAWLEVTPPDERSHRLVPFGGMVCNHGHLTVTALGRTRTPR